MPSAEQYAALIAELRRLTATLDAAGTEDDDGRKMRLTVGYEALREVIVFLAGDPKVREGGLIRPLGLIENALHDAARGARPSLLDHSPEGPGTKPRETTREDVQGVIVAAVHVLLQGKWGTRLAVSEIARLAGKAGVRCADGGPVLPRQVQNWYSEHNRGGLPTRARDAFNEQLAYERKNGWLLLPRTHPEKRAKAERAARRIVDVLAGIAPRAAPPLSSRLKQ